MPIPSRLPHFHSTSVRLNHCREVICTVVLSLCLTQLFLPAFAHAQGGGGAPRMRQPPQVLIHGVLLAPEDKTASDGKTLTVHVNSKRWKLRISEIKTLTETSTSGWSLLNDLFPRRLHLIGPADLLAPLQQDAAAGKPLTLEGRLYVGDQQLLLSTVAVQNAAP